MSDVKLTGEGDLSLEEGDFPLIESDDALVQRLHVYLSLFSGEYWLDIGKGVPYFDRVYVKGESIAALSAVFQDAILSVDGVRSLDALDLDLSSSRFLTVNFTVNGNLTASVPALI